MTARLPRSARIKKLAMETAAELSQRAVSRALKRQSVSASIGYAVAVTIGAVAGYFAWWAGLVVAGFYILTAYRAVRRYREVRG